MEAIFNCDNILKDGVSVTQVPSNTGCEGHDKCRLVRDMLTKSGVH